MQSSGTGIDSSTVDAATDPAEINNAPTDSTASQQAAPEQAMAPSSGRSYGSGSNYGEGYEQGMEAAQPPPPLPEYQQPECPQPGYQWTPGYWSYAQSGGYYWVPGVWVAQPYQGSLWTPGYWGLVGAVFAFHQGYWGAHVGYYGGILYGHGYNGTGFYGGYWNSNNFMYNRSVTNINTTTINNTSIYNHTVVNNYTTNNYRNVSYNGGPGGIRARPTPEQLFVAREPHINPLPQQIAHRTQAAQNPAQFAKTNGGRPAVLAAPQPLRLQQVAAAPGLSNPGIRGVTAKDAASHPELNRIPPTARPNEPAARPSESTTRPNPEAKPTTHASEPAARPNETARPKEEHTQPAQKQNAMPQTNAATKHQPKP